MHQKISGITRIPPFSKAETIQFYATGEVPERFRDSEEAKRKNIIENHINPTRNLNGGLHR